MVMGWFLKVLKLSFFIFWVFEGMLIDWMRMVLVVVVGGRLLFIFVYLRFLIFDDDGGVEIWVKILR